MREADIVWWTGLPKTLVRAALVELAAELTEVELIGVEGRFMILRVELEQVGADRGGRASGMTLLPMLDHRGLRAEKLTKS